VLWWVGQDKIDRGSWPEMPTSGPTLLRVARRWWPSWRLSWPQQSVLLLRSGKAAWCAETDLPGHGGTG